MSAQKGGNVTEGKLRVEQFDGPQNFELIFERETVAGFSFNSSSASTKKPMRITRAGTD